ALAGRGALSRQGRSIHGGLCKNGQDRRSRGIPLPSHAAQREDHGRGLRQPGLHSDRGGGEPPPRSEGYYDEARGERIVVSAYPNSSTGAPRTAIVRLLGLMRDGREIRQYLQRFSQVDQSRFAVIKVGGAILRDELAMLSDALAFLQSVGLTPVVVHG